MLPASNPELSMALFIDESPVESQPTDKNPWSKVARIRNAMLGKINLDAWDYLLWIDADVVGYPLDMPRRLIRGNPTGVSAPLVLIQDRDEFYDWAAFVMRGADTILPEDRHRVWGRNLAHKPPYWHHHAPFKIEDDRNARPNWYRPPTDIVEMDCVGTITMVPAWVYLEGARYEDHPAFTDHYPICKSVRDSGGKVTVDRTITAYHADLPKFNEAWH